MSDSASEAQSKEMQRLNIEQKAYYEEHAGNLRKSGNVVTRTWTAVRNRVARYRNEVGIKQDMRNLHYEWFGDLSGCDTMELGCASGNSVSCYLAEHSASYLGVDLSSVGVANLNQRLAEKNLPGHAVSADFLADDFGHGPFDVIYAQGVLHHFEHFETFLQILHSRLKPGGRVVAFDPLQTALLPRVVRAAYRPFQSDADWEWPFSKQTFENMEQYFEIKELQGMMGWSKWGILALPFGVSFAAKVGRKLHQKDMRSAKTRSRALWRCMNVATLLIRKD